MRIDGWAEPRLEPPPEPPAPRCPVCGAETDTVYLANTGEAVGCCECLRACDAWERCREGGWNG